MHLGEGVLNKVLMMKGKERSRCNKSHDLAFAGECDSRGKRGRRKKKILSAMYGIIWLRYGSIWFDNFKEIIPNLCYCLQWEFSVCSVCVNFKSIRSGFSGSEGKKERDLHEITTWLVHNNWRTNTRGHTSAGSVLLNPCPESSMAHAINTTKNAAVKILTSNNVRVHLSFTFLRFTYMGVCGFKEIAILTENKLNWTPVLSTDLFKDFLFLYKLT